MKKIPKIIIYTDGGVSKEEYLQWAWYINDKTYLTGTLRRSFDNDVELAEAEALFSAVDWIYRRFLSGIFANYEIQSDSRAVLDKIKKRVNNSTRIPHIKGIQNMLEEIKDSPNPINVNFKWQPRRSNEGMKKVDDLCDFKDRK
jgi:ribonuclease HI